MAGFSAGFGELISLGVKSIYELRWTLKHKQREDALYQVQLATAPDENSVRKSRRLPGKLR